ncbi:unnamed protein product [Mytilus coruscus]|uniref:Reverse transcriptase domain-containing protein n=1 Tax=Mytilus coruscus TaxID=42192 RepID=A0A6J8E7N5_MYTCO|nr:unnamed protein product [Mytilus coruscus]
MLRNQRKRFIIYKTLDSQKAFDVVNHQILLDKLYYLGVDIEYWDAIEDMYNSVTSTVKWQGDTGLSFSIDQGVSEILSSHLYKHYINELLSELEAHNMGISIGNTYAGCPSCADDIVYCYQTTKTKCKKCSAQCDNIIEFKSETTHLGLKRTTSEETKININDRISLARRTLDSLIKTGVHGTNGLNPRTSCKIYQVYVIPRLLYGLETLNLQNKDIIALCSFHLSTLKHIQSLPNRTATSAVYLLLGALPITAELHKRQLSFLHSIAMSHNNSIREIAWRQHTAVKLKADCDEKSTLKLLSKRNLNIGQTHNVWDTISNSVKDVRKATTKVRMLTGTYMLQTLKVKFNQAEVDPTYPICKLKAEDLQHLLTSCPAYRHIRKSHFQQIKEYVVSKIGSRVWTNNFNNKMAITELLIDCQSLLKGTFSQMTK